MNFWMKLSIEFANQRNYLDELFAVYPTIPNGIRDIDQNVWKKIEKAFMAGQNELLIKSLLELEFFPIKDSYVAFLRRDKEAIKRNPQTINRLCGRLYEMGLDKVFEKCSEPKETNRQIGPLFKEWVNKKSLGILPVDLKTFLNTSDNAILMASDNEMKNWANEVLGYKRDKGLDFVARFNGKYIIGEAKFLTDFGGHQNADLDDAISTLTHKKINAVKIAILDGVVWLKTKNKLHTLVTEKYKQENIMSALVLREFLYSL